MAISLTLKMLLNFSFVLFRLDEGPVVAGKPRIEWLLVSAGAGCGYLLPVSMLLYLHLLPAYGGVCLCQHGSYRAVPSSRRSIAGASLFLFNNQKEGPYFIQWKEGNDYLNLYLPLHELK